MCDWATQHYKGRLLVLSSSGADGKSVCHTLSMRLTGVRICLLANFFSPFSNHIRKAFIFLIKMKRNNKKVEHKVSGRVRVGIGRQGGGAPLT